MGRSKSAAAFGIAALLIAGSGAYAVGSGGGKMIRVCVKRHGGTLYKAKRCAKHDKKLTWNMQGRQGVTGVQGPKGHTGNTGSSAPGFFVGRSNYVDSDSNTYATPTGTSVADTTAANVDVVSPAQGTIVARDLYISVPTSSGHQVTVTLAVNGVDTALHCTVNEPTSLTCSDTTDAVSIPPQSTIVLHESHSTGGGVGTQYPYRFAWRATTP